MTRVQKNLLCIITLTFTLYGALARGLPVATREYNTAAQWVVIGAGPAGIIIVGLLLDLGTDPKNIIWIDPEFSVGRMGKYYNNVPGNVKTKHLIEFINSCKTFQEVSSPAITQLHRLDMEEEYPLKVIVQPLQEITYYLCERVLSCQSALLALSFENDLWRVETKDKTFTASHVILATGSHPKRLDYDCKQDIPLDLALDKNVLEQAVNEEDTVGVIGSGQSAILLLKHLSEINVGRVINFWKHPIDFENPESGLKGITARWAKEVLLKTPPLNLIRIYNTCETLEAWIPICTKIIYAVGFERNDIPLHCDNEKLNFDDRNGIIGPRLFGIGIAFPEKIEDEKGKLTARIGLVSFMEYAQQILPVWMATRESLNKYKLFDDLLTIDIL